MVFDWKWSTNFSPFIGRSQFYSHTYVQRRLWKIVWMCTQTGEENPKLGQWHKIFAAAAAAKSLQSYPTLCDPIDGSPLGSTVPGILQARTLEWVAISFSNAWKCKVKVKSLSCVWLLATPWTAVHQAPPSMGFSRQEYWSGMPLPSPEIFARWAQWNISHMYP